MDELCGHVDGDIALALAVARIGDELAAIDHAARVVDVAESHFDRFGAGLAIFTGRTGQFHHQPDGDVAIGRLAGSRRKGQARQCGHGQ